MAERRTIMIDDDVAKKVRNLQARKLRNLQARKLKKLQEL